MVTSRVEVRRYHEEIVEEEDFSLMQTQLLFFVGVCDFVETAVAHQTTMWQRQLLRNEPNIQKPSNVYSMSEHVTMFYRLLSEDHAFNFEHLRDVVGTGFEFA